jgi:hypothetical protein
MINMLETRYDHKKVEEGKYEFWKSKDYFKSGDLTKEPFCIVIPPPNVTGKLHLGHAWDTTLQDIIIRYKRMDGYDALWLPGMDHAGIATQAKVDKKLKSMGFKPREMKREEWLKYAWDWKKEYAENIHEQWANLGLSLDYSKERFTLDEGLNKAVTKVFIDYYNKGLIYRGERIINWDPEAQTALSNEEVIYKDTKSAFYHIKYFFENSDNYLEIATTLTIHGKASIKTDVEYWPSEDPIEAMSLIAAGVVTDSEITIRRVPIEFVELELAILKEMHLQFEKTAEYSADNQRTRLVDITLKHSELIAPKDKLHSLPFPGVNMDNLPFLGLIATVAKGRTLVHDWSYENRAIYFTELTKLNANIEMVDPHRVYITGPTRWKPADVVAPPALRPSVVVLLAMLAAPGKSILRDVYNINRGYEDFANRLNALGADIEIVSEW